MTYCDRLAAHFRANRGRWIDGMELATVAGSYAWRSRASELRKPPYSLTIENRQRKLENGVTVSEYRFVPREPAKDLFEAADWSAAAQGERG